MIISNLKTILKNKDISATALSKMSNVSRTSINQLVNNISGGIQFDTANKICAFLGITLNDLLSYAPIDVKISEIMNSINNDKLYIELSLDFHSYNGLSVNYPIFTDFNQHYSIYFYITEESYPDGGKYFQIDFSNKKDILIYQEIISEVPIEIVNHIIDLLKFKCNEIIQNVYNNEYDIFPPYTLNPIVVNGRLSPVNLFTVLRENKEENNKKYTAR